MNGKRNRGYVPHIDVFLGKEILLRIWVRALLFLPSLMEMVYDTRSGQDLDLPRQINMEGWKKQSLAGRISTAMTKGETKTLRLMY